MNDLAFHEAHFRVGGAHLVCMVHHVRGKQGFKTLQVFDLKRLIIVFRKCDKVVIGCRSQFRTGWDVRHVVNCRDAKGRGGVSVLL